MFHGPAAARANEQPEVICPTRGHQEEQAKTQGCLIERLPGVSNTHVMLCDSASVARFLQVFMPIYAMVRQTMWCHTLYCLFQVQVQVQVSS